MMHHVACKKTARAWPSRRTLNAILPRCSTFHSSRTLKISRLIERNKTNKNLKQKLLLSSSLVVAAPNTSDALPLFPYHDFYSQPSASNLQITQQRQQQRRHYLFLPTSWTEFKLRVRAAYSKRKRVLHVVLRDRFTKIKNTQTYRRAITRLSEHGRAAWVQSYRRQKRIRERAQRRFQGARVRLSKSKRSLYQRGVSLWERRGLIQRKAVVLEEYAREDWFDALGRPLTSRDATGRFVNPWQSQSSDGVKGAQDILRWRFERWKREFEQYGWKALLPSHWRNIYARAFEDSNQGEYQQDSKATPNKVPTQDVWLETCRRIPSSAFLSPYNNSNGNGNTNGNFEPVVNLPPSFLMPTDPSIMSLTWIGHATCLVQSQGTNLLFDPMFSKRASPWQNSSVGIARDLKPACTIEQLPDEIDLCCISHDHYDHLDRDSVDMLKDKVHLWIVALGMGEWMANKCGISPERVIELEWWQSVCLFRSTSEDKDGGVEWEAVQSWRIDDAPVHPARRVLRDDENIAAGDTDENSNRSRVWITGCPVQHWASRTFFDRNYRLWCSFAVLFDQGIHRNSFYFAGDSALPSQFPLFEQIGDYLGPVHMSALPIGAYQPDYYMRDAHMNPEEAVSVHKKLASNLSVGMHWGSFPLSEEPMDEPPRWLAEVTARERYSMGAPFGIIPHGGRIDVTCRGLHDVDSASSRVEATVLDGSWLKS